MTPRPILSLVLGCLLVLAPVTPTAATALGDSTPAYGVSSLASMKKPKIVAYKNCTALKKVHRDGVAKAGVKHNTVSGKKRALKGKPVFSTALYNKNKKLDRDRDGIACERS